MAPGSVVDIHTHIYPPSYIQLLKSRQTLPYIRTFADHPNSPRLIILPGENEGPSTSRGRPVGPEYWDIGAKLAFMDAHGIATSVISLANPWLDFLPADEAPQMAKQINDEIETLCAQRPGRLFFFAALPLSASTAAITAEVERVARLKHCRGVILGTSGLGQGLDDPALELVWAALQEARLMVFLHPHYGLPASVYGPRGSEYGHVLPLALGFPLETTIAVTAMYLSRLWDRLPELKFLLAHSGGTIPFLIGRIQSCIQHDGHLMATGSTPRKSLREVLRENVYLDAVTYGDVGLNAAIQAVGKDKVMFGTDHPFFPPLTGDKEWLSVRTNYDAIGAAFKGSESDRDLVLGGNAIRILGLDLKKPEEPASRIS